MKRVFIVFVMLVFMCPILGQEKESRPVLKSGYTFTIKDQTPKLEKIGLKKLCGLKVPAKAIGKLKAKERIKQTFTTVNDLPAVFNWAEQGYQIYIRDQGACGSCWAFAMNTISEAVVEITMGHQVNFSEQYLMDCNSLNYGCNGGFFDAFDRYITHGYVTETCCPYRAEDFICQCKCAHDYVLFDWFPVNGDVSCPTIEEIKQAIIQYGPVCCGITADSYFQYYNDGVYNHNAPGSPNHAVVLYGWNDAGGHWYLQNSWGDGWGENGTMRIKYNCSKIGTWAVYLSKINKESRGHDTDCPDSCQAMSGTSLCLVGFVWLMVFSAGVIDKRRTKHRK